MKCRFIWIGKTRDKNWKALQEEYLQRLSRFVRCEVVEIRDSQPHDTKEIESKRIADALDGKGLVCLLDVPGKPMSSHELAAELTSWQNRGVQQVSFIIGGADGVTRDIAEMADIRLSLSFMTFTHEMARVILLEQLYRAYTIVKGYPYQK